MIEHRLPGLPLRSFAAGYRSLPVDQFTGHLNASCAEKWSHMEEFPFPFAGSLVGARQVADALQGHMSKSTYRRRESAEVARRLLKNPGRIPSLRRRDVIRLTSGALRELGDAIIRKKVMRGFVRSVLDFDFHGKQGDQVRTAVAKVLRPPPLCPWDGEPLAFLLRRDRFASGRKFVQRKRAKEEVMRKPSSRGRRKPEPRGVRGRRRIRGHERCLRTPRNLTGWATQRGGSRRRRQIETRRENRVGAEEAA